MSNWPCTREGARARSGRSRGEHRLARVARVQGGDGRLDGQRARCGQLLGLGASTHICARRALMRTVTFLVVRVRAGAREAAGDTAVSFDVLLRGVWARGAL